MLELPNTTILAGKYAVVRALASGGMGTICVARHLQLGIDVAVKQMIPAYVGVPDARARFEREARAAAGLSSPHLVPVHDYGVHDGLPFLVMELLRGEDLAARIRVSRRDGPERWRVLRRSHGHELLHPPCQQGLRVRGELHDLYRRVFVPLLRSAGVPECPPHSPRWKPRLHGDLLRELTPAPKGQGAPAYIDRSTPRSPSMTASHAASFSALAMGSPSCGRGVSSPRAVDRQSQARSTIGTIAASF
jgi:hypothetical protein